MDHVHRLLISLGRRSGAITDDALWSPPRRTTDGACEVKSWLCGGRTPRQRRYAAGPTEFFVGSCVASAGVLSATLRRQFPDAQSSCASRMTQSSTAGDF
jgi:hypothetical protein